MKQIEKQSFREAGNLDAVSYFQFLVREGYRLSLIRPEELEALQVQIIQLLTDRFNRWTGGQSSSVPADTGQRIQQSTFYTVGYYLKSLSDAEKALEELKNHSLEKLFQKGKDRIGTVRKEAQELLYRVQENRLTTDVFAYNDTLVKGIPMFFFSYDPDFEAHETPASIDYPLGNDKMNLTGIEYISVYLQKLNLENEFCRLFSDEDIHSLLRGYDRQYKELLFNIYDLILTNAVGCMLLCRNDRGLNISEHDRRYLQSTLSPLPAERLDALTDQAVSHLQDLLSITDPGLSGYMEASAVNLKSRLKYALESNGLKHFFLSVDDEDDKPALLFEDKAALDHGSFLMLADEIRECRLVSDKVALLQREPLAMTDLIDLLEGDCFFRDEYQAVFAAQGDIRLALLIKKLPLDPVDQQFLEEENDREWKSSFYSWLSQMDPGRKAAILALSGQIDSKDIGSEGLSQTLPR